MGQILFTDKVGALSFSSPNVLMAASVSSPAYLTIGGQQYTVTSQLSVNAGSLTLQNLYHVYAVISGGVVALAVSTNVNSIGPVGFTSWKLIGAFYTNTSAVFSGFVAKTGDTSSSEVVLLSGSAATYTAPASAIGLRVKLCGGGGGGGGTGGTTSSDGTAGTSTTFAGGAVSLTGFGGAGGNRQVVGGAGVIGNVASGGDYNIQGGQGSPGGNPQTTYGPGGTGGANPFGGAGGGAYSGGGGAGGAAVPNTGAGGGGACAAVNGQFGGGGGGAGGYLERYVPASLMPASFLYTIGSAGVGVGGTGPGAFPGGNGATGVIIIEELKPNLEQLKDL